MSFCKELGKDRIIFVTKEDHEKPSTVTLPESDGEEKRGLILENGDINWNCPCLGGMASGPCGYQFRDAFSCFHYSEADPKGSDCIQKFAQMQECMNRFPNLYPNRDDDEEDKERDELIDDEIEKNIMQGLQSTKEVNQHINEQNGVQTNSSGTDQQLKT
jgi:intermembrane space import and assembly protein 40